MNSLSVYNLCYVKRSGFFFLSCFSLASLKHYNILTEMDKSRKYATQNKLLINVILKSFLGIPRLIQLCRSPGERNNSDAVLVACLVRASNCSLFSFILFCW